MSESLLSLFNKRVTLSESLLSFFTKEWWEWFARFLLYKNKWFAQKQFFTAFPHLMPKSKSLLLLFTQSLFFKEQLEQFALIVIYKRAAVSKLLMSLIQKYVAMFVIRSWKRANRYFDLSLTKNKWFNQKPKSRAGNSLIWFPSELLVFCPKMSEWAIRSKKRAIHSFAHFWWLT